MSISNLRTKPRALYPQILYLYLYPISGLNLDLCILKYYTCIYIQSLDWTQTSVSSNTIPASISNLWTEPRALYPPILYLHLYPISELNPELCILQYYTCIYIQSLNWTQSSVSSNTTNTIPVSISNLDWTQTSESSNTIPVSISNLWTEPRAPYPPVTMIDPFPNPTAQWDALAEGRGGPAIQLII